MKDGIHYPEELPYNRTFVGEDRDFEIVSFPFIKNVYIFLADINHCFMHTHREMELLYILKGTALFSTAKNTYQLHADETVLVNSGCLHELSAAPGDQLIIICVQLSPRFFENTFPQLKNTVFDSVPLSSCFSPEQYLSFQQMLLNLSFQYFLQPQGYPLYCTGLLSCLFYEIISHVPWHIVTEEERKAQNKITTRLNRILNYIDQNYMNKISLSEIASREGVTLPYMSRFFREHLNTTFQNYVTGQRLFQAQKLLTNSDKKLIDICLECGFSDYRYLYQAFMKECQCTPQEYRKKHLASPECQSFNRTIQGLEYNIPSSLSLLKSYAASLPFPHPDLYSPF